jgi:hypothetical protein
LETVVLMKTPNCPAIVTIIDRNENEYTCKGRYYGDGRIICEHNNRLLMVDPSCYNDEDPKRLFDCDKDTWTKYRIKSVLLDSRFIRKNR